MREYHQRREEVRSLRQHATYLSAMGMKEFADRCEERATDLERAEELMLQAANLRAHTLRHNTFEFDLEARAEEMELKAAELERKYK